MNIQTSENLEKTNSAQTKFQMYQVLILGLSALSILFLGRSFLSNKKRNKLLKSKIENLTNAEQ